MKWIVLAAASALAAAAVAGAGGAGGSANGGSHLIVHDVFGLETLVLQEFGFNAKLKADGAATAGSPTATSRTACRSPRRGR